MATTFSLATPASKSTVIAAASFNALANSTCKLGGAVTPGSNPPLFSQMQLTCKFASNITAGTVVAKCWIIEAVDGTNYDAHGAASDATTNAPARTPDFTFVWPNIASQLGPYVLQATPLTIARPPNLFKILIQNTSGQAFTTSATDSILEEATLNEYGA